MLKVVHFINWKNSNEEELRQPIEIKKKQAIGVAIVFQQFFDSETEISTIVYDDKYFLGHEEEVIEQVVRCVDEVETDIFIAGPVYSADNAGKAECQVCEAVQERFDIPSITAMDADNANVNCYKNKIYIFPTQRTKDRLRQIAGIVVPFAIKLVEGKEIGSSKAEGYIDGIQKKTFKKKNFTATLFSDAGKAYEEENYKYAFELYLKAANLGNVEAMRKISQCYHRGWGIDKDNYKAVEWLRKAADQGDKLSIRCVEGLKEVEDLDKYLDSCFLSWLASFWRLPFQKINRS